MSRYLTKELTGGAALFAIGLFFFLVALDYRIGTARQMGPGYFPMLLGAVMMILAAVIVYRGIRRGQIIADPAWRPFFAVLASIVAFGIAMRFGGLVPAILSTVLISAAGDRTARLFSTAVVAVGLSLAAWLIFVVGLGLPMAVFRGLL